LIRRPITPMFSGRNPNNKEWGSELSPLHFDKTYNFV
jgi:hypothetical protein